MSVVVVLFLLFISFPVDGMGWGGVGIWGVWEGVCGGVPEYIVSINNGMTSFKQFVHLKLSDIM